MQVDDIIKPPKKQIKKELVCRRQLLRTTLEVRGLRNLCSEYAYYKYLAITQLHAIGICSFKLASTCSWGGGRRGGSSKRARDQQQACQRCATTNREQLQRQQRTITGKNKSIPTDAPEREKRMWPLFPTRFARTREPWIPFRHGERVLSLDSIPSLRTDSFWSTCRHLPFFHQSKLVNPIAYLCIQYFTQNLKLNFLFTSLPQSPHSRAQKQKTLQNFAQFKFFLK